MHESNVLPFITGCELFIYKISWESFAQRPFILHVRERRNSIMAQTHGNRFLMNIYRLTSLLNEALSFSLTSKSCGNDETLECSTLASELAAISRRYLAASSLLKNRKLSQIKKIQLKIRFHSRLEILESLIPADVSALLMSTCVSCDIDLCNVNSL